MDKYEINVLTRKGGWKKLSQEVNSGVNDSLINNKINSSENLNNKDSIFDKNKIDTEILSNLSEIGDVIEHLQNLEKEKEVYHSKLKQLKEHFLHKKNRISGKIEKLDRENDLYIKTIELIESLIKT